METLATQDFTFSSQNVSFSFKKPSRFGFTEQILFHFGCFKTVNQAHENLRDKRFVVYMYINLFYGS